MEEPFNPFPDQEAQKAYLSEIVSFIDRYYRPSGSTPEFTVSTRQLITELSEHFVHIGFFETDIRQLLQQKGFLLFEVEQMNFQWGFSRTNPSLPS